MNLNYEQGPPLRAIQPVEFRAHSVAESGVPLRGGFINALPNVAQGARPTLGIAARAGQGTWSQFPESFAASVLSLSRDKCAPPVITWMPGGCHCIRPQGSPGDLPVVWIVDAKMAAIANRHLQALRAKAASGDGQSPFIDFNHDGGVAGEVTEIFWENGRILASVSWTAEGEAAVLEGRAVSFSPHWINHGQEFLGLRACVGGVLSPEVRPAFQKMPSIIPVRKRRALEICAERFLRKVDRRANELAAQGHELAALRAHDELAEEWPALFGCHDLRQAIREEHWEDIKIRHA